MKRNVIVGAAGSGTGFAAITSLRKNWGDGVFIVGLDTNPRQLVTASLLVDKFVQVPFASEPSFWETLQSEAVMLGESFFMPLLPEEVLAVARQGTLVSAVQSLKVIGTELNAAEAILDKFTLFQKAHQSGMPCPKTELAKRGVTYSREFLLKPRFGYGSKGISRTSEGQLPAEVATPEDYIVQDYIHGPELTIDAFHQRSTGFTWSVCRERIEVKSGVSVKCRLFREKKFDEMASALASVFKLNGAFCFQVIQSPSGPKLIDLNPRPGAGTSMSALTGNDFFKAGFSLAFDEEYERCFAPFDEEVFVTRQYVDFLS
ncbi:MAG: ATP-grasp domain-containing protein [Verrucomicrobia bacterium]|nr:ATP-grasp domain-containing protein [Verrucomicrobiota bacterium]